MIVCRQREHNFDLEIVNQLGTGRECRYSGHWSDRAAEFQYDNGSTNFHCTARPNPKALHTMYLECEENAPTFHDNTGSPLSQKTIPANDPYANETDTHWTKQHIDVVSGDIGSCRRFSSTEMNARGPDGVTPLMIAATSTNSRKKAELEEILDILIYNGAYLNETTDIMSK